MSAGDPNGAANEVFEESGDERQSQSIQHIRANSSIMQLKKILGKPFFWICGADEACAGGIDGMSLC
jgi:hypothetical protein